GELPADSLCPGRGYSGDRLLPGRRIRLLSIVVTGGPGARQTWPVHPVLGQQQIEHRCDELAGDPAGRYSSAQHAGLSSVVAGEVDFCCAAAAALSTQQRVDAPQVEVPMTFSGAGEPVTQRSIRNHRTTGTAIQQHGLGLGTVAGIVEISGGEEFS